ncbi:YkgJ family cysteine cluster protein [Candidatus Bathyarchaeota archaeon]|nr:YkgJ family cysteine cluster protein [Candidatus Bathyarchaeota archaeon]
MAEKSRQTDFLRICEKCRSKCCYEAKPPLTTNRIKIISHYLKETRAAASSMRGGRYSHPEELDDGYCALFDHLNGFCRVHPVKPETCVAGPITFDINRKDGKIEWYLKTEKICFLAGEMARDPESLSNHLFAAKREILKLVEELEGSALLAILEIDEEDTFKIGEDSLPRMALEKIEASSRASKPEHTRRSHSHPSEPGEHPS